MLIRAKIVNFRQSVLISLRNRPHIDSNNTFQIPKVRIIIYKEPMNLQMSLLAIIKLIISHLQYIRSELSKRIK